ncbi:putative lipoprotein YmbA [Klebsiella variicola]|nr:putative lipoprotein YmbA [Klebsiella variicola]
MKKWLLVAAVCVMTACSSGGESKTYYQLPVVQGGAQSAASQGARLLWVEQVSIPDYLAGNGVVYQTTDVQYVIANNNLWASPLDQQLRTTLVANLSQQLPGWVVSSQPLGSEQDTPQCGGKWLSRALRRAGYRQRRVAIEASGTAD